MPQSPIWMHEICLYRQGVGLTWRKWLNLLALLLPRPLAVIVNN